MVIFSNLYNRGEAENVKPSRFRGLLAKAHFYNHYGEQQGIFKIL